MSETEKRRFAFHPPLIAAFPILAIYSANTGLFPLHDLFRPILLGLGLGIGLWLIFALVRRSWERGAFLASIWVAGAWAYQPLTGRFNLDPIVTGAILLGWLVLICWLSTRQRLPTAGLNRFAVFLVVMAALFIGIHSRGAPSREVSASSAGSTHRPDVFFVVLDGYGRADQLERVMGFDNEPFLKALRARGFMVLDKNHSNYCQTALSFGSMLNLDYLQTLLPKVSSDEIDRDPAIRLVNRPRIVKDLRSAGYDSIAIGTGFPSFEFEGFDLYITDPPAITYFESTVLELTPFKTPPAAYESQYEARRRMLKNAFGEIQKIAPPTSHPRFVFTHVLAPHPPFVFDAGGREVRQMGIFSFYDASDYMEHGGTPAKYTQGYTGQVQWVNQQVLKTVDALLARPGEKPIIIFQGDHGSKERLDQNDLDKTDLHEALSPLGAYYLPSELRARITPSTTPVNVMRGIVSYVTGEKLDPLPDRTYYSTFAHPFGFTDITDRVRD